MKQDTFQELFDEMNKIDGEKQYYALTLTANKEGQITWSTQTHWAGFTGERPRREIRKASMVRADRMIRYWHFISQPHLVVNKERHFLFYTIVGGNALIEQEIARQWMPDVFAPSVCALSGPMGFVHLESLPKQVLNRAPTPKRRMRILKRDERRCRICGRRPIDYVDVELHIHHIRPWANGGLTEDQNLITLCHTCHKGLDPHQDFELYSLLQPNGKLMDIEKSESEFWRGVYRYREIVRNIYIDNIASDEGIRLANAHHES